MASPTAIDVATRTTMAGKKKNWIKDATANSHGQFKAKAKAAGETTRQFAADKADAPGKTGAQARLAQNLMGAAGHKAALYTRKKG